MLRAVVVGFVIGFALVGVFRLAQPEDGGTRLTSTQALSRGAALDHVSGGPCEADHRPVLVLA